MDIILPTWYMGVSLSKMAFFYVTSIEPKTQNENELLIYSKSITMNSVLNGNFSKIEGKEENVYSFQKKPFKKERLFYHKELFEQYIRQMIEFYPNDNALKELLQELTK